MNAPLPAHRGDGAARPTRRPWRRVALAVLALLGASLVGDGAFAQGSGYGYPDLDDGQIAELRQAIEAMKQDPRGPWQRIRWFCNDGTVQPPEPEACRGRGGGHQHAEPKPAVGRYASWGFHLGTILQATPYADLVDADNAYYRLRELVLQDYLEQIDDGWILRRARFYRGARQAEDEQRRGSEYLARLLSTRGWRRAHPLLATRLAAALPHGQPGLPGDRMRSLATSIAEADANFMDLRIKIHSTPGPGDLDAVTSYRQALHADADPELVASVDELVAELRNVYRAEVDSGRWQALAAALPGLPVASTLASMPSVLRQADRRRRIALLADLLRRARDSFNSELGNEAGERATALLDAILYAAAVLRADANAHVGELTAAVEEGEEDVPDRRQWLGLTGDLADAAYGAGWLTEREHQALIDALRQAFSSDETLTRNSYRGLIRYIAHATEWAQGAVSQIWGPVIDRYQPVEPLAARFRDEVLRGSVLLPYARVVDLLSRDASRAIGMVHTVFGADRSVGLLGLNPGIAAGPLRFVDDVRELASPDPDAIYVLPETPADLGRVAGILTLDEGSSLSHVQLLARSLGIPNAVIPAELARQLRAHEGQEVFYAVSAVGSVILKQREEMTAGDVAMFQERAMAVTGAIDIDENKLDLSVREILDLADVGSDDSGRIVGPKAANLGQLHRLFPDRVAPGLVIPFGIFRAHTDRDLDGDGRTLHEEILSIYERARVSADGPTDPVQIQNRVLRDLRAVREEILGMELLPGFRALLEERLREEFGEPGTYGVFVRSDTNVEDLPTFSGAGLNFTAMNQVGLDAIFRAIREVWASPFTERSYMWRQRILADPGSVYPSILLLRSVPADASGVLVTADLSGSAPHHWTVTLSPGIGGVVEGEPAETVLLPSPEAPDDAETVLLSSSRATWQKVLQVGGGIRRVPLAGTVRLLTPDRADDLRGVVARILRSYPPTLDEDGAAMPWDIEFGFVDHRTMLFQIRPFVTDRLARTLTALQDLDSRILERGLEPLDLDEPPQP